MLTGLKRNLHLTFWHTCRPALGGEDDVSRIAITSSARQPRKCHTPLFQIVTRSVASDVVKATPAATAPVIAPSSSAICLLNRGPVSAIK